MNANDAQKPKIVFPFVEAGLGHIMPMTAIADTFEKKYGDEVEVVRTKFFLDTHDARLINVEQDFIDEVKRQNKHKSRSKLSNIVMHLLGTRISMRYIFKKRHKEAYSPALQYMQALNADIIFSTHLSTHYYACEAKKYGFTNAKIIGYCTDPIIGLQWDNRVDLAVVSSRLGVKRAQKFGRYKKSQLLELPFLLRKEVESCNMGKAYYRNVLNLPADNFTILLSDGAYGAGKLRDTVYALIKQARRPVTIIAVCGKNEALYQELCILDVPKHIHLAPYGFTDKTLLLSAACDLFMGKAGASSLAEPIYFGTPAIVTFLASFVEKWICDHHVNEGCAIKATKVSKAVSLALDFAEHPDKMRQYTDACKAHSRCDGPEIMADRLYYELYKMEKVNRTLNGSAPYIGKEMVKAVCNDRFP